MNNLMIYQQFYLEISKLPYIDVQILPVKNVYLIMKLNLEEFAQNALQTHF